jgi:hypothetical protein
VTKPHKHDPLRRVCSVAMISGPFVSSQGCPLARDEHNPDLSVRPLIEGAKGASSRMPCRRPMSELGQTRKSGDAITTSALPPTADVPESGCDVRKSVESRCDAVALGSNISVSAPFVRRCLTGSTMSPFSHPLIEPDRQISRIRLSDKTSRLRVQRLLQLLNIYRS